MRFDVDTAVTVFQKWLYLPDPTPLLAVLGTVAANRRDGDPVWLVLVGPPGGGKSELLTALGGLPGVHPAATLTEAALLSGTSKKERAAGSKGGLLKEIGQSGIIVCKDFGSVLSMNRDARAAVLAALREVYDGAWTRHLGTDGGIRLHWDGKVGLVAGCTPTIDRHHAVMGAMGERVVLFRLPGVDSDAQALRSLAHAGHEGEMRQELSRAVAAVFAQPLEDPQPLDEQERSGLVALTTLAVRARSTVERDGYSREIELIPDAEAPTRLIVVLERLLAGLSTIGVRRTLAWNVVVKAALDSIPAIRRAVIETLYAADGDVETPKLAEALGYPTATTKRALEDLTAHGVAHRTIRGSGQKADSWQLTDWATERWEICNSEKSSNARSSRDKRVSDISESQPEAAA